MALFPPDPETVGDGLNDLLRLLRKLSSEDLTECESDFVESMQERVEKYRGKTFLSAAQEAWLDDLADKYGV